MKNGKTPGSDNIAPELLTMNPNVAANILHPLFRKIWEKQKIPVEGREGLLVKLPKKGDISNCHKWRGITLLSIPSKVLARIILNRIKEQVEERL